MQHDRNEKLSKTISRTLTAYRMHNGELLHFLS